MTIEGGTDDGGQQPVPTLFWVAAYLVQRVFVGHEEGGWWTDLGELVTDPEVYRQLAGTPAAFVAEGIAEAHADRLRANLAVLNACRWPLWSMLSTGLYEVLVIAAPTLPAAWPERMPTYG